MITATRDGKYITRNASFFKNLNHKDEREEQEDDFDFDFDYESDDDLAGLPLPAAEPIAGDVVPRYPTRDRPSVHRFGQNVYEQGH